ncbi:MAG: class I SAM-dependent methyltransferase [Ilumatobacteraceae bacterium]
MSIWFGDNVPDDGDLRLCGDLTGKRAIELGIAPTPNAITMALGGAKAMVLDPSADRIADLRAAAESSDVRVECHRGELADLGFATSGSVDVVVAAHTLAAIDDLPRLLRQVHRVLKPGASFVVASTHPVAAMFEEAGGPVRFPYGARAATFGELSMAFERTNFHIDVVHELADRRQRNPDFPAVLVVRARKQGV